jgi:class 3 adenylate cyclase
MFALIAGMGAVIYIIGFGFYLFWGKTAVMVHLIVWSSLAANIAGTIVAGGVAWSGGFMLWGLINAVIATLFLSRRWAAALAGSYALATSVLVVMDPWLRDLRDAPDPWFPTLIAADILIGSLVFMVPLTMRLLDQLEDEHGRSRALMLNILPESVADRLKVEEDVVDALPEVTSVFADIVGFTEATTGLRPEEVVAALNQIFTSFDEIASRHGLEKIKTIGDGYLAVSGAPIPRVDHLECVADAALEMVAVTQGMTYGGVPLQVRMGIDTGPVVAGVIGTSKFSYDLWGDSVNTASRMESHGEPGRIQVTARVFDGLASTHRFTPRGQVEIKSKGSMETYFLEARLA